jgi:hypothetical protein
MIVASHIYIFYSQSPSIVHILIICFICSLECPSSLSYIFVAIRINNRELGLRIEVYFGNQNKCRRLIFQNYSHYPNNTKKFEHLNTYCIPCICLTMNDWFATCQYRLFSMAITQLPFQRNLDI